MRKVILNLAVTLDGFIEGPTSEVDWCRVDSMSDNESGTESHFDKFLADIDTIFYGQVSYDAWGEYQPGKETSPFKMKLWDGVNRKTKYVFSRKSNADSRSTFISNDIAERVKEIKEQSGKNIWLYGGSGLITTFMNLQIIDNYLLAVYPVVLGAGKPLFKGIQNRIGLKLKNVTALH